jgi:hypothetical protein
MEFRTSRRHGSSLEQGTTPTMGSMPSPNQLLETRVRRILAAALPSLRIDISPRQGLAGAFDIIVRTGASEHPFLAGWAGEGWPKDVTDLITRLPGVEVAVGTKFSEEAKEVLAGRAIGWVDEAGSAEISRPSGLLVIRQPAPASAPIKPSARWSRSVLTTAEAILSGTPPTVNQIEQVTGLSRHATATSLVRLEQVGHLERSQARRGPASNRTVVNADDFLASYVAAAADRRSKQAVLRVHRLWTGGPFDTLRSEIGPVLNASGYEWAATGTTASLLLAPYLSESATLDLYVDPELLVDAGALATRLGGRIVESGHVIEVREFPTPMSPRGPVIDGVHLALPIRVYADLRAEGGRAAEAASHLREVLNVGNIP